MVVRGRKDMDYFVYVIRLIFLKIKVIIVEWLGNIVFEILLRVIWLKCKVFEYLIELVFKRVCCICVIVK